MLASPRRWREVSLADVSFKTFAALVNSRFTLRESNGGAQALELVQADLAAMPDGFTAESDSDSFSLFFRGDVTLALQQDTYSFEHARIGRLAMFIVPIGCDDHSHSYYEAVFNRTPPASRITHHDSRFTHQAPYG